MGGEDDVDDDDDDDDDEAWTDGGSEMGGGGGGGGGDCSSSSDACSRCAHAQEDAHKQSKDLEEFLHVCARYKMKKKKKLCLFTCGTNETREKNNANFEAGRKWALTWPLKKKQAQ